MTIPSRRRLLMALPVAGAGALGLGCWKILSSMEEGGFDPRAIRTEAMRHPLPDFSLGGLPGAGEGFDTRTLSRTGEPVLVNFFASWCIPCVAEMDALRKIARFLPIWGIAYKDRPEDARRFVLRDGSPYRRIGLDPDGMTAIEWGVTGVPESFLVLPGGHIAWHASAALDARQFEEKVLPLTREAK
ncbi:redoxin family protein [Swaminathania salitolerans]|uniref:Cytochrome C-type biogenesis protein n=1 Tax=Swaminathania salitolerans TaxID=182838 RepID=A0A511BLV6_9PROT|nr:redoxin family protein [Swaminathania salitolerans]GBQ10520.1 cytochrome c biogenesis thiol:disulfide interchange protein DsbE [Swaminathania salitolerans LMG 21291]GEL01319.1 cytochrome C-type biogenesis protein [Swaminathania salitolerans]